MALPSLLGSSRTAAPGSTVPARVAPLADAGDLPALDRYQPPWAGREITSGTVTLHVRETPGPEGETPAVYLHGLSGSATNWTDLAAQLAPHARGMALDLPGFGLSKPPVPEIYGPSAQADATAELLAGLDRPVHLLGNSLGGVAALMVAARRPELVRTLTLLAPAMPDRRPDPRRMSDPRMALAAIPWLRTRVSRQLAEMTPRQRVEQMLQLCWGDPTSVAEHRIEEAIREGAERVQLPWVGDALWSTTKAMVRCWFAGPNLWSLAAKVTAPTLVVWGGRDRLVSPRLARRTTATLPKGRLLAMPEVGHVPQIERPVPVARAVLGMWQAVDSGRW